MKYILLIFLSIGQFSGFCQPGCTDPQALNYDPAAMINDGSCIYPNSVLNYSVMTSLSVPSLNECSGIEEINNQFWVHVDNGSSRLYKIDSVSSAIFDSLQVSSGNQDWEDLAQSDSFIYIGNFGNNFGNRTNMNVLRIPLTSLSSPPLIPDSINFSYADQVNFTSALNNTQFDCEAFFFHNDSLHLFTKDWVTKWTRHYVLPANPGNYSLMPVDSMNVSGLITSADIIGDSVVALLGYNAGIGGDAFVWLLHDYIPGKIFSGNKRKLSIGSIFTAGQVEGVSLRNDFTGFVINEAIPGLLPPQLKKINLNPYFSQPTIIPESLRGDLLQVFPGIIIYKGIKQVKSMGVYSLEGKCILNSESTIIYTSPLPPGIYICRTLLEDGTLLSVRFHSGK
jgi:hypothetical protein